jgi:phosphatidate cytidylyltransferase
VGEGDKGDKKDDLFEDLDKFFAPIQDVDWPESAPPASAKEEPAETAAPATPPRPPTEEAAPEPVEGRGEPFVGAEAEGGPGEEVWPAEEESAEPGSFLFETEEYEIEVDEPEAPGHVGSPGSEEEELELEGEVTAGEEPSTEAVEAADHFAESVREEVRVEPVEPGPEEPEGTLGEPPSGSQEVEEEILAGLEEPEQSVRTVVVGPEGLGGPSWQEPTAVEIGPDHVRKPVGRDLPAAFLTGLVLAAVAIGAIAIGAGPFAIVATAIVLWAQGEFYLAMQKRHLQPATALGLVSGALVLGGAYYRGEAAMLAVFALSVFATFLWYMAQPAAHRKSTLVNLGATVLGVAYVPLLAGYALAMLKAMPDGRGVVLSVIGLSVVYDTAAFIVGYFWGSRPLSPSISPKKSWEGAIGATLVVIAVAVGVVAPSIDVLDTVGKSVALAVVVALFAPFGDLAESLIKRDLGLKDMGSILPGHGGVMDRIDSLLFVAPAAYMFMRLILL